MATEAPANPAVRDNNANPVDDEPQQKSSIISTMVRYYVIYMIVNQVAKYMWTGESPSQGPVHQNVPDMGDKHKMVKDSTLKLPQNYLVITENLQRASEDTKVLLDDRKLPNILSNVPVTHPQGHLNLWQEHQPMSCHVYLSTSRDEAHIQSSRDLIWKRNDLSFSFEKEGDISTDPSLSISLNISLAQFPSLLSNKSLFAHVYLTQDGYEPPPERRAEEKSPIGDLSIISVHEIVALTTLLPPAKKQPLRTNLLSSNEEQLEEKETHDDDDDDAEEDTKYVLHWKPELRINPVIDFTPYATISSMPPFLIPYYQIHRPSGHYLPLVYLNEFWILQSHLISINSTLSHVPLSIEYAPLSMTKLALTLQMTKGFRVQEQMGTQTKKDADGLKKLFLETNPILLTITVIVSLLHTVFDMLAFKNDVSFWKQRKSMQGLSLRTVLLNAVFHLVIFLYLLDNDTTYMILFSNGIGLLIEFWKITKAVSFSRSKEHWTGFILEPIGHEYYESPTAKHDKYAVTHLSYAVYPLVLGYAAYTLNFSTHKSWYSWILSSLTGFVHVFGFILMTPQVFGIYIYIFIY